MTHDFDTCFIYLEILFLLIKHSIADVPQLQIYDMR